MTRRLKAPRLLTVGDVFSGVVDHLAEKFLGPRCPVCWERTHLLDAHVVTEHYPGER